MSFRLDKANTKRSKNQNLNLKIAFRAKQTNQANKRLKANKAILLQMTLSPKLQILSLLLHLHYKNDFL